MRHHLIHGFAAGGLSSAAALIYRFAIEQAMFLDFSLVIGETSILMACFSACLLMSIVYAGIHQVNKPKLIGWINLIFVLITCFSLIVPISITLPLDVEFPEMFPGFAMPMHFFPVLSFLGLAPFFAKSRTE